MNPLLHLRMKTSGKLRPLKFPYPAKKLSFVLKLMHQNCACEISVIETLSKFFALLSRMSQLNHITIHHSRCTGDEHQIVTLSTLSASSTPPTPFGKSTKKLPNCRYVCQMTLQVINLSKMLFWP